MPEPDKWVHMWIPPKQPGPHPATMRFVCGAVLDFTEAARATTDWSSTTCPPCRKLRPKRTWQPRIREVAE